MAEETVEPSEQEAKIAAKRAKQAAYMRAYRKANPEKNTQQKKLWEERYPEHAKALKKEWQSRYYEANKDTISAKQKERYQRDPKKVKAINVSWVKNNPDKVSAFRRAWRIAHPDVFRAANARRRALKNGAQGSYSAFDIQDLFALQKGKCAECKRKSPRGRLHVDHIIPLALGGSNFRNNLQLMCRTCNSKKGAKHPIEFARLNGRLI